MSDHKSFVEHAHAYLAERRAMGFALQVAGKRVLAFAQFADLSSPSSALTTGVAVAWARQTRGTSPVARARRLEIVRPFARYLSRFDPRTEIPPRKLLGPAHRRLAPDRYTEAEVFVMLGEAMRLTPIGGLRPMAVATAIGLLACTGLRVSEAPRLRRCAVNLQDALLDIRRTKFKKRRWVPLHPTAARALATYAERRDRDVPNPRSDAFFLMDGGVALTTRRLRTAFQRVRINLGWDQLPGPRRTLRCLRHTFACDRLLRWHTQGESVDRLLLDLSTYLGHGKVTDTYWYLNAFPALLGISGKSFERFAAEGRSTQ